MVVLRKQDASWARLSPRLLPEPPLQVLVGLQDLQSALAVGQEVPHTEGRGKKTLAKYEKVFERVQGLAKRLRRERALGINAAFLDEYRHERNAAQCAPKTIYNESIIVRQIVNYGVSRRLLAIDPLKGYRIPEPKPTRQPCWTPGEVDRILSAAEEPQRAAYTLLAETGMRVGELQWLTWDDVDFDRNVLHIRPKEGGSPRPVISGRSP